MDVETKLPTELHLRFITVRPEERVATLLVLLKNFICQKQQTVVFAATKHHVEYLHMVRVFTFLICLLNKLFKIIISFLKILSHVTSRNIIHKPIRPQKQNICGIYEHSTGIYSIYRLHLIIIIY